MKPYYSYSEFIKKKHGERVQKISIDAGFTCPNRDGKKGIGGCAFCNNDSFSPGNRRLSITDQINNGIAFYQKRRPALKKFTVYFQSYTNTYADLNALRSIYNEALQVPGVIGLSIGTRADCLDEEKFNYFEELARKFEITLEIGIETCHDQTLKAINRGHDLQTFLDCIQMGKNRGIYLGTHLILGLPGETPEMMLKSIQKVGALPIQFLKFHQLHIVKNTLLGSEYQKAPFPLISKEDYFNLMGHGLTYLSPHIAIQRFFGDAPHETLLSELWPGHLSLWTQEFEKYLLEKNLWQGKHFIVP